VSKRLRKKLVRGEPTGK